MKSLVNLKFSDHSEIREALHPKLLSNFTRTRSFQHQNSGLETSRDPFYRLVNRGPSFPLSARGPKLACQWPVCWDIKATHDHLTLHLFVQTRTVYLISPNNCLSQLSAVLHEDSPIDVNINGDPVFVFKKIITKCGEHCFNVIRGHY